jgi:hypothetical protein
MDSYLTVCSYWDVSWTAPNGRNEASFRYEALARVFASKYPDSVVMARRGVVLMSLSQGGDYYIPGDIVPFGEAIPLQDDR